MFFVFWCVCVFLAARMACRILVPHPLQWNLRVLKAGPPGKSLLSFVVDIFSCSGKKTKKVCCYCMADYKVNVLCKFPNNTDIYGAEKFPHNLILKKTVLMMCILFQTFFCAHMLNRYL